MAMNAVRLVLALVLISGGPAWAQSASVLEGAWAVESVTYEGANPGPPVSEPTGLVMFTGQHYSMMFLGTTDRPDMAALEWNDASADTLLAVWGPLTANAGTFELSGDTVTLNPTVAKNTFPIGASQVFSCELDGDALVLSRDLTAPNGVVLHLTVTLTRVE